MSQVTSPDSVACCMDPPGAVPQDMGQLGEYEHLAAGQQGTGGGSSTQRFGS